MRLFIEGTTSAKEFAMTYRALAYSIFAASLVSTAAGQGGTRDATPLIPGGQWAGGYGEISDQRVVWDPFTIELEVDGDRLGGTFFHTKGGTGTIEGTQ